MSRTKHDAKININVEHSSKVDKIRMSNKTFFSCEQVTLYNADFLSVEEIVGSSIDLIVTSPPYNVGIKYNSHDDAVSYDDYLDFSSTYLKRCFEVLKDDGRFCFNVPLDKNKGGQQSIYADLVNIAKKVGFKYHSTIVWNEQNISRRTAWGSWLSASAPFVIAPVEMIAILYKNKWKKESGSRISDIDRQDFMDWTNGFWTFSGESKARIGHPSPFPVALPHRCIKLFSYVGDVILDPFVGSGSTLIAAVKNNRKGIGVEIDEAYCKIAKERLIKEGKVNQAKLMLG